MKIRTTLNDAERSRLLTLAKKHGRAFVFESNYQPPSEAGQPGFKRLADLTEMDAQHVIAIGYGDGGIDFANEYMRDCILTDVRRMNAVRAERESPAS